MGFTLLYSLYFTVTDQEILQVVIREGVETETHEEAANEEARSEDIENPKRTLIGRRGVNARMVETTKGLLSCSQMA